MRMCVFGLLAIVLTVFSLQPFEADGNAVVQDEKPTQKLSKDQIEKLVKQLGSENPKTREEASAALRKIGPESLPYLKAAFKSADPEQKRRAEDLHAQILQAGIDKHAERVAKYGIDVVVERMVRRGKDLSEEDWAVFASIVEKIRAGTKRRGELASREYLDFPIRWGPEKPGTSNILHRARAVADAYANICEESLVVCTGSVNAWSAIDSVVLANGNIKCERAKGALLVCDGSISIATMNKNCAVIARGKVKLAVGPHLGDDSLIIDEYRGEVAGLRFFSLRDLGTFFSGGGRQTVQVAALEKGSLLEKAGLEQGDVVVSINGKSLADVEQARALFRSAMADGQIEVEYYRIEESQKKVARVQIHW